MKAKKKRGAARKQRLRGPLRIKKAHHWRRASRDFYVEPVWCDDGLFAAENFEGSIWDPACGSGRIVQAALAAEHDARGTDITDRSVYCEQLIDFLKCGFPYENTRNIVSNPPFSHAEEFARQALTLVPGKVALLLQATWVLGDKRSRWLEHTPLKTIYFITPRPSMPPGHIKAKPGNGTSDYAWFVWDHRTWGPRTFGWIRRPTVTI